MNYSASTVTVGARVGRETLARLDAVVPALGYSGRSEAIREALELGLRWLEGRARAEARAREEGRET